MFVWELIQQLTWVEPSAAVELNFMESEEDEDNTLVAYLAGVRYNHEIISVTDKDANTVAINIKKVRV